MAADVLNPFGNMPYTYIWTLTPSGGSAITQVGQQISFAPGQDGIYTIDLSVLSAGGNTRTAHLSITVVAPPST
jgi:hypothetical protein